MVECVPSGDVVDEECPGSASIVTTGYRAKTLLTSSVPDLEFDLLAVDCDHSSAELDAYSEVVDGLEPLVCELEEETGLANACVADYDVFE